MICIVLAAGYAMRMYPLTENFPKPLLKVQGKPILNWLLEDVDRIPQVEQVLVVSNHKFAGVFEAWLREQSFRKPIRLLDDGSLTNETRVGAVRDISVALAAVGEKVEGGKERTKHGHDLGKVSQEFKAVGSAEEAKLPGALVLAGDNVLEFSLQGFVDFYQARLQSCIMCYQEPSLERRRKTGIITLTGAGKVTSFEEKPAEPKSNWAVPPFYCYTVSDLRRIPEAVAAGCSTDAPGSLAAWLSVHSEVYAWPMPGRRYDIGSIAGYEDVQKLYHPPVGRV